MLRRQFIATSACTLGTGMAGNAFGDRREPARRFTLAYAPHFGMFENVAGDDLLQQLRFAADQGFYAWEDNGMKDRPVELQNQIASLMQRRDIYHQQISEGNLISNIDRCWDEIAYVQSGDNPGATS
jgi:hydroxypyruvate isomerase